MPKFGFIFLHFSINFTKKICKTAGSGTSFAAPIVAGGVALILEKHKKEISAKLSSSSLKANNEEIAKKLLNPFLVKYVLEQSGNIPRKSSFSPKPRQIEEQNPFWGSGVANFEKMDQILTFWRECLLFVNKSTTQNDCGQQSTLMLPFDEYPCGNKNCSSHGKCEILHQFSDKNLNLHSIGFAFFFFSFFY